MVTHPTPLEEALFRAKLPVERSLSYFYDLYAGTTPHREELQPSVYGRHPDIHRLDDWEHRLYAFSRGEWFAHVLSGCESVLDVGTGSGFPSLYLAPVVNRVVAIDVSAGQIALARELAQILDIGNVTFKVGDGQELPFEDESFDGVCFGGASFGYGADPHLELREANRVLIRGGLVAVEDAFPRPDSPSSERIAFLVDCGPPMLHLWVDVGLCSRRYLVRFDPQSTTGQKLLRARNQPPAQQDSVQQEAARLLEKGDLSAVTGVDFTGDLRSLSADEFLEALKDSGFGEIKQWHLPYTKAFGHALEQEGLLGRFRCGDLKLLLRSLIRGAPIVSDPDCLRPSGFYTHVTCRKA